ncbi:MAG: DUF192 domain-containing protein [candidate division WOR-3 bacterium]
MTRSGYRLLIDRETLSVEIAATEEARRLGLMHRQSLREDAGMLFVFDTPGFYPFWMHNTHIPLSIAFLSDDSTVLEIQDMTPEDITSLHVAKRPFRYALEVNQGWFEAHGIVPGMRFSLIERTDGIR